MLFLFYGEDDYLMREQARHVEAQYAEPDGFNLQRLDGATVSWDDVVGACSVLPFLSQYQVVRLSGLIAASGRGRASDDDEGEKGAKRRRGGQDDGARPGVSPEGLRSLLDTLPETTVLIMEEGDLKATNAHLKAINGSQVSKEVRRFALLDAEQRVRWTRETVRERGGEIDPRTAELLAARLPGGVAALSNAIDTLICFAGPSARITSEAVQALVAPDEDDNVFHLTDAIANKDAGRALVLLHTLLNGGMAVEQMLAILVGRLRDWILVAALNSERVSEGEAISRLGWTSGKYRAVAGGVRRFGRGELPDAYQALVIADAALKSRPADERPLLFDMLVFTLATRGKAETLRQAFPIPVVG